MDAPKQIAPPPALTTYACTACKQVTQTDLKLEACPTCGSTASPFVAKDAGAAAAPGAPQTPPAAPGAPAPADPAPTGGSPAPSSPEAPGTPAPVGASGGPDWGQIAQLLLGVLQGAGAALTGVLTGGAATSLVFGEALLRIVQAAVAAYEAHKGQPIDPSELSTENPIA